MHKGRRMLYVGGLFKGSTGLERKNAFEVLGYKVITFDTDCYARGGNKIMLYLTYKLSWGPAIKSLNRDLIEFIKDLEYDVVWISKGIWLYPQTVNMLKKQGRAIVVHYNTDDPFGLLGPRCWKIFIKAIPEYDIHFVRRRENIEEYLNAGAHKVIQVYPNFSIEKHYPVKVDENIRKQLGGPIGFIGDYEDNRSEIIRYLAENGIPVRIWGPNWKKKCSNPHPNMRIEGRGVYAEDYTKTICSFDINLAFLRKCNRDLSTSRSVEIPACESFMLAERTSEHLDLFEEGEEAEFFSSKEELLNKVNYYLEHPDERIAIAKAGRERCLRSGYDNETCMRRCLEAIFDG